MTIRVFSILFVMGFFFAGPIDADDIAFQRIARRYGLEEEEYLSLFNDRSLGILQPHNFALITIPKSGTHLVCKLLALMTGKMGLLRLDPENDQFRWVHIWDKMTTKLLENRNLRIVTLSRDPRDITISAAHFFKSLTLLSNEHACDAKSWNQASFDEKLALTIGHPEGYLKPCLGKLISLMQQPNVHVCRFENLIGPSGGGSLEKQEKEILELAGFLNIHLSKEQLDFLCRNLFGNTPTFREGKIDSWKAAYKSEHKELFKKMMGDYLIELGYESSDDW